MSIFDTTSSLPVTISLLPVSLGLVHIPRSRLSKLSHHVLQQILQPSPKFLNVTANELELSILAEHHLLASSELNEIAQRDKRRRRRRSRSDSNPLRGACLSTENSVEVSYDHWSVLQIDSHYSGQLDKSGARVHELSAPLAAAGISILYQSSYMSDFIFVKEKRLQDVMTLLSQAGFDLYADDAVHLASRALSPVLSPLRERYDAEDDDDGYIVAGEEHQDQPEDSEGAQKQAFSTATLPSSSSPLTNTSQTILQPSSPSAHDAATFTRSKSHSPTPGEVSVLTPELACVGLVDDSVENWALKIVKLVAFPELVPRPAHLLREQQQEIPRRVTTMEPGLFSPIFESVQRGREGDERHPKRRRRRQASSSQSSSASSSHSSSCDFDDDQDYESGDVSSSSRSESRLSTCLSATSLPTSPSEPTPASPPAELCQYPYPRKSDAPLSPPLQAPSANAPATITESERKEHGSRRPTATTIHVPFFSFTRMPEGSSLTTDVDALAALFAPHERHMVICGDELDAVDRRWAKEEAEAVLGNACAVGGSGEDMGGEERFLPDDSGASAEESGPDGEGEMFKGQDVAEEGEMVNGIGEYGGEENEEEDASTTLKCLQIDLRRFGLDKHGLVNRFSRVLEEAGINHIYSSAYKTANLLVNKKHAVRAQALLRSC